MLKNKKPRMTVIKKKSWSVITKMMKNKLKITAVNFVNQLGIFAVVALKQPKILMLGLKIILWVILILKDNK